MRSITEIQMRAMPESSGLHTAVTVDTEDQLIIVQIPASNGHVALSMDAQDAQELIEQLQNYLPKS